jgi:ketosteroid isomerase-like protein
MRNVTWLCVVAPLVLWSAPSGAQSNSDRREITSLEERWIRAVIARDVRAFDRLLHPDFVYTEDDRVYTKAQLIKEVTTGSDTVTAGQNEGLEVRIFGNTAVATGWLVLRGRGPKGPFVRRYRYTDTWLKSGPTWRVIAAADYLKP